MKDNFAEPLFIESLIILFILFFLMATPVFAQTQDIYQFQTSQQKSRFNHLIYELRCLVCQNQNLAESQALLAGDLRRQVADKILQGQTNDQILNYLVDRYGDFILYRPPLIKKTIFLWVTPFALLFFCLGLLILLTKSYRRTQKT